MAFLSRLLLRLSAPPQPLLFIGGMPKSGTTAILQLVGLASGASTCNDPFYQLDLQAVQFRDALFNGTLSPTTLMRRYPRVFRGALIKDPNLSFFYPVLSGAYPTARWIFTIRDPRHNIRSILNRLKLPGTVSALLPQMGSVHGAWGRVLRGESPALAGADPFECMARRWVRIAEDIRNAQRAHPEHVVVSRYEDFVLDKQGQIQRLCEAVGLTPQHSVAEHVNTQFQPKGDRSALPTEFFGAAELATIDEVCGPWLEEFGYAPAEVPR